MVRVAGVVPAWTCAQGGPYPTPGLWERPFLALSGLSFYADNWRSVCTTSTRSRRASMTASMDWSANGVSSITSACLRHSTPAVALEWSSSVNRRLASARDMARPAPMTAKLSWITLAAHDVRTRSHAARNDSHVALTRTAPLRVMSTFSP